jgi:hypothetical protein
MGPIGSSLAIVGLAFCATGWIGKRRLERWQSALDRQIYGDKSVFHRLVEVYRRFNDFCRVHVDPWLRPFQSYFLWIAPLVIVLAFALASSGSDTQKQSLGTLVFFVCLPIFVMLFFIFVTSLVLIPFLVGLFGTYLLLRLLSLPYEITRFVEHEQRLERTFQLLGFLTGVAGVLVPY